MWHLRRGWLDPATLPAQYAPFTEIGKLERLEARSRGLSYSAGPAGPEDFPTADEAPPTSDPLLRAATDTRVRPSTWRAPRASALDACVAHAR